MDTEAVPTADIDTELAGAIEAFTESTLTESPAAPSGSDASPATEPATPGTDPALPTSASAAPAAPAETPGSQPPVWVPPSEGKPLAFRVDSRDATVPGALTLPNGDVYIPAESWERHMVKGGLLADRNEWRRKEQGYSQALQAKEESIGAERAQINATLKMLDDIRRGPGNIDQKLQTLVGLLDSGQWDNAVLRAKLQHIEQQGQRQQEWQQQQAQQQQAAEVEPVLQNHLGSAVHHFIGSMPKLKVLDRDKDAIAAELWEDIGKGFYGPDPEQPGAYVVDEARLIRILERRAQQVGSVAEQAKKLAAMQAGNQAAVKPTVKVAKPQQPARKPDGTFAKQDEEESFEDSLLKKETWGLA